MVALHHIGRVCGSAVNMHVIATDALNEPRGSPHTDAPAIARVWLKKGVRSGTTQWVSSRKADKARIFGGSTAQSGLTALHTESFQFHACW